MTKNQFPLPHKPVRGSISGKPIMAVFDLLGRNWAMGIIWYLSQRSYKFRELQSLCETISPTTLNKRIKELTNARLITRNVNGYILTDDGSELAKLLVPINTWAEDWAKKFDKNE